MTRGIKDLRHEARKNKIVKKNTKVAKATKDAKVATTYAKSDKAMPLDTQALNFILKLTNQTKSSVSKDLGWSTSALSHYASHQTLISKRNITKLADHFGVGVDDLMMHSIDYDLYNKLRTLRNYARNYSRDRAQAKKQAKRIAEAQRDAKAILHATNLLQQIQEIDNTAVYISQLCDDDGSKGYNGVLELIKGGVIFKGTVDSIAKLNVQVSQLVDTLHALTKYIDFSKAKDDSDNE